MLTDFCEFPGCLTYREITVALMQRFSGELYIRSRQAGAMLECLCEAIVAREPGFFDDIPFLAALEDRAEKRAALLAFAQDCGLYHNFGLIKMNVQRTMQARGLFENEFQMYMLHTASGQDDLLARPSTSRLADIALGHHSWYNGAGGYP